MPLLPLLLLCAVLHTWVGWRIAPALASVAAFPQGAPLFWALLVASALMMPMGVAARRLARGPLSRGADHPAKVPAPHRGAG